MKKAEVPNREADQIPGVPVPEEALATIGHQSVLNSLMGQLNDNRLPGGVMLHGPRGIGKATLAFELARNILVQTGDESAERVREQIKSGVHPNVFVLRKMPRDAKAFYSNIRVEDVRKLVAKMHQTRGREGHRVCIIDAIDDCNRSSANALLKTLEEPPAETHFILISHRPGQLLPTIRSRCQAHAMRPLDDAQVRDVVSGVNAEESSDISRAIQFASGKPRRAFEALALGDTQVLQNLTGWLQAPQNSTPEMYLSIAKNLSGKQNELLAAFAKDIVLEWISSEAHTASQTGLTGNMTLASANALWENANKLFLDAQTFNLDAQQTLITLFDAIRKHAIQSTKLSA